MTGAVGSKAVTKYVFLNFPTHGQLHPSLAIAQELVSRGEEVVYFNFEKFRTLIEATGAGFRAYDAEIFRLKKDAQRSAADDNRRLAMISIGLLLASEQVVPSLLKAVESEKPDCLVYSDTFLWGRIIADRLELPAATLRPTYASDDNFREQVTKGTGLDSSFYKSLSERLKPVFNRISYQYRLSYSDVFALFRGNENLKIVFLTRTFQPDGASFDDRYLFVGPSFHPDRDKSLGFPAEKLDFESCLYISLGTMYTDKTGFYRLFIEAFANQDIPVVMSLGNQLDRKLLPPIPGHFIAEPYVPQLEILPRADLFISHGGMNSTMESLYFGVPLIVIPHTNEQKITARRVRELDLGVALDQGSLTAELLRSAVSRIRDNADIRLRTQEMKDEVRSAGGYKKAVDALQVFTASH
jgi:MGT family glycosyltransferase